MRIIINEKQLKMLNEIDISVDSKDQSASGYINAVQQAGPDIQKARKVSNDVNAVVSGPKTNDSSVKVDIDVPRGSSVQSVVNSNPDYQEAINGGASAEVHGDGFVSEMKFTKKQIEEARINNIQKNGQKYTKKQLQELFNNN